MTPPFFFLPLNGMNLHLSFIHFLEALKYLLFEKSFQGTEIILAQNITKYITLIIEHYFFIYKLRKKCK